MFCLCLISFFSVQLANFTNNFQTPFLWLCNWRILCEISKQFFFSERNRRTLQLIFKPNFFGCAIGEFWVNYPKQFFFQNAIGKLCNMIFQTPFPWLCNWRILCKLSKTVLFQNAIGVLYIYFSNPISFVVQLAHFV